MLTSEFHYLLPNKLIAQQPAEKRTDSRLMTLNRASGTIHHQSFNDLLTYLRKGDLLVLNDSKVFPARLRAIKHESGGRLEVLLLEEISQHHWWAMLRPGKRVRAGSKVVVLNRHGDTTEWTGTIQEKNEPGHVRICFEGEGDFMEMLNTHGEIPLPPYIERDNSAKEPQDRERYQTVYAGPIGSVAAPTAGLHFSQDLLDAIQLKGIGIARVTLHVGYGTFAPVKAKQVEEHTMHSERYEISKPTADAIHQTRSAGGRIIAVGTTSLRVLESIVDNRDDEIKAQTGHTQIFITPPYSFKIVDALLTNFHLPGSTLLMLVSAFASPGRIVGRETILAAYREAIEQRYRFFSYGDAMFLHG